MAVTWNPSNKNAGITLSNGNLTASCVSGWVGVKATQFVTTGKWYWEITKLVNAYTDIGVSDISDTTLNYPGSAITSAGYEDGNGFTTGKIAQGSGWVGSYPTYAVNDIIGVALDMDGKTVTFYINNTFVVTLNISTWTSVTPYIGIAETNGSIVANFGATSFAYTIPIGHIALDSGTPVTSVKATSTNQAIIPIVSTNKNITISSIISSASSEAIIPMISGTSNFSTNINGIVANASIQAINPTITTVIVLSASIVAFVANCTSQSKVPLISAIKNEIALINISESIRKPLIQTTTANHIINQLSRRIRTEVM